MEPSLRIVNREHHDSRSTPAVARIASVVPQVLFKKGRGSWEIITEERLSFVHLRVGGDETATFVRAQVDHFCAFSMVRKVTENDRYKQSHQRNRRTIVMRNTCKKKVLVVMMPTTAVEIQTHLGRSPSS